MIVTLKDGSKKEYAEAKSVIDIAYDISEGLARAACASTWDAMAENCKSFFIFCCQDV